MKINASLHIHTKEDFQDGGIIGYSIYNIIDRASEEGFKAISLTGHRTFLYKEAYGEYAGKKGVVLIPGIELRIKDGFRRSHVLVLGCGKESEGIDSFKKLADYKRGNPGICIIAPHTGFDPFVSLSPKKAVMHIGLFDAFEHSWFYTKFWDRNGIAQGISERYGKPLVATADLHHPRFFTSDYAVIDVEELSVGGILDAVKKGRIENVTRAKTFGELAGFMLWYKYNEYGNMLKGIFKALIRR